MPMFDVKMRVTYRETWAVDAKDEAEARKLCEAMDERVEIDESGGACVNWEVTYVGKATT